MVLSFNRETLEKTALQRLNYEYVVSYSGGFDRDKGLENLLDSVSRQSQILLNIARFGVLDE